MKSKSALLCMLFLGVLLAGNTGMAVPYAGNIDLFEGDEDPWTGFDGATSPAGNPGAFTINTEGGVAGDGFVYTTDADFIGNYTLYVGPQAIIRFAFGGSASADQLSLYFTSSTGGTWYYALTPADTTFSVLLGTYTAGWQSFDLSPNFANAIADIDQIGLYVQNKETGSYIYTLDNFEIAVPEPETVWMIMAVVLSLGITFRGRILELAGSLKARLAKN